MQIFQVMYTSTTVGNHVTYSDFCTGIRTVLVGKTVIISLILNEFSHCQVQIPFHFVLQTVIQEFIR